MKWIMARMPVTVPAPTGRDIPARGTAPGVRAAMNQKP